VDKRTVEEADTEAFTAVAPAEPYPQREGIRTPIPKAPLLLLDKSRPCMLNGRRYNSHILIFLYYNVQKEIKSENSRYLDRISPFSRGPDVSFHCPFMSDISRPVLETKPAW
jgi:hypothetical protein